MRTLRIALLVLSIHYAIYAAIVYSQQDALFFPGAGVRVNATALPAGAELVEIPAAGATVRAVYLPPADPTRPVAIYFHGNDEFVRQMGDEVGALGSGVLAVEFPGYDGADGAPTVADFRRAGDAAYDWLAARGIGADRIVAIGRSMGGGPACLLAGERPLAGLALLSTFASTDALAHGRGLPGWLVKQSFDNRAVVAAFKAPLLIVHGSHDEVLDFANGQSLAAAAPAAKFMIPRCGHNDCDYFRSPVALTIRDWLRQTAGRRQEPARQESIDGDRAATIAVQAAPGNLGRHGRQ
jgi:hypothetical protein